MGNLMVPGTTVVIPILSYLGEGIMSWMGYDG